MIHRIFLSLCLISAINLAWGQESTNKQALFNLVLQRLDSSDFPLQQLKKTPLSVIFFLSPECPLCENYSLTIRTLQEELDSEEVAYYGIFSGTYFSPELIQTYLNRYKPNVIPLLDPGYQSKRILAADVTPEAFVLSNQGEVLYQGSIDNWIPALGKKRTIITRHYLKSALQASLSGEEVPVAYTKAIGCFIE